MTGTVREIHVPAGRAVAAGDELMVVESMKMEIPVECPVAGTVVEVLVAVEDHVDEGAILIRLETA
jgi:biotin carboxyl carrier protein